MGLDQAPMTKPWPKEIYQNTPGTAGGPGGRDRTLAVKSLKKPKKSTFFRKKIKIT